jgi:hypothetical protein
MPIELDERAILLIGSAPAVILGWHGHGPFEHRRHDARLVPGVNAQRGAFF